MLVIACLSAFSMQGAVMSCIILWMLHIFLYAWKYGVLWEKPEVYWSVLVVQGVIWGAELYWPAHLRKCQDISVCNSLLQSVAACLTVLGFWYVYVDRYKCAKYFSIHWHKKTFRYSTRVMAWGEGWGDVGMSLGLFGFVKRRV